MIPRAMAIFLALTVTASFGCASQSRVLYSAIYLDMDGTTLDSNRRVRPATIRALERYKRCGGQFGIATGRTLDQLQSYLPRLQPNLPLVLSNGAVLQSADGKRTLAVEALAADVARAAMARSLQVDGILAVVVRESNATIAEKDDPTFLALLADNFVVPTRTQANLATGYRGTPIKVVLIARQGRTTAVKAAVSEVIEGKARAVITSSMTVEVVANGVSKARPILAVLRARGLRPEKTLLFGDGNNDVEMLSQVGLGLAMGNCRPAACRAANRRIGDHDSDAIAAAIESLALTPACR